MKNNIDRLVKKILNEQGLSQDGKGDETAVKITDDALSLAYKAACFPSGAAPHNMANGQQVMLHTKSSRIPGFPYAVAYPPKDKNSNGGVLEYYKNDFKTKDPRSFTWTCAALRQLQQDAMNPELEKFVKDVTESKIAKVYLYGDTENVSNTAKVNGACVLTKLSDFIASKKELQSRADVKSLLQGNPKYIWVCSQGPSQTSSVAYWEGQGYKECTQDELLAGAASVSIKDVGGLKLCKPKVGAGSVSKNKNVIAMETAKAEIDVEANKKSCQSMIEAYRNAALSKLPIPQNQIDGYKDYIIACRDNDLVKKDNFLSKRFSNYLEELRKMPTYKFRDGSTAEYKLSTGAESSNVAPTQPIRESILKRIIRENLNELSESKKKALIEENNIIQTRFGIIAESGKPRTKKQKEQFIDDALYEMFYLNSQGFNQILVNEGFMDIIKSFFGNAGEGIFNTIKERFAQFLVEKITPMDPNGYLANIIVVTVGNIPIGDYFNGKIFKCDYLSDVISKSVGEGIVRKIQNDKGMEGPLYDVIRNSLIEMFEDTEFGQKIENFVGDLICPSLSGIQDKMAMAGEAMKQKALS